MGKMWRKDEEGFGDAHLGCISGIFHVLDSHYWHSNVKKILPDRKHDVPIKGSKRSKIVSNDQDSIEVLKLFDAKTGHILANKSTQRSTSSLKKSLKRRIKALISEERGPTLQRTYSIHHLESDEWVRPIIFFPKNVKNEDLSEKSTESQVISQESSEKTTNNDYKDVEFLENFKVKDAISLNILPETKAKLTKSGSFPASGSRNMRPMMLKHKLNESFLVSKNEKNSDDNLKNSNLMGIRRVFSLNESANRYTSQLFDSSDIKEAIFGRLRSLKSTNKTENSSSDSQNERNVVMIPSSIEECIKLDSLEGPEVSNGTIDRNEVSSKNKSSVCLSVDLTDAGYGSESSSIFEQNFENKIKIDDDDDDNKSMDLSSKHNNYVDDFTYVKEILDRSGFIKNSFEQPWYSSNQPLNPSIFQEIESQYFHDEDRFEEELIELSHHLLLFDLVDEVLLNTNELTWPTGIFVLDEVWKNVSEKVNTKPDMNQSLDSIVFLDLKTDKSWMNLRLESEGVAVELEDLIFDELVEEMLWS